jgi:hypothetical protein
MDNKSPNMAQREISSFENKSNKKENKFTEDEAMDIVDVEFQELEDWMKKEMKNLKQDAYDIVDCLKVNKSSIMRRDDY